MLRYSEASGCSVGVPQHDRGSLMDVSQARLSIYNPSMSVPMLGTWAVEVKDVSPFSIHGDIYYELRVQRTDAADPNLTVLRVPQHATDGQPKPGDRLSIKFIMGQVTSAKAVLKSEK